MSNDTIAIKPKNKFSSKRHSFSFRYELTFTVFARMSDTSKLISEQTIVNSKYT